MVAFVIGYHNVTVTTAGINFALPFCLVFFNLFCFATGYNNETATLYSYSDSELDDSTKDGGDWQVRIRFPSLSLPLPLILFDCTRYSDLEGSLDVQFDLDDDDSFDTVSFI